MSCLDSVDVKYLGWVMALAGSEAAGVGSWVTPGFLRMGLSMLSAAAVDGQGPRRGQKADHCAYLRGGTVGVVEARAVGVARSGMVQAESAGVDVTNSRSALTLASIHPSIHPSIPFLSFLDACFAEEFQFLW